jgi:HSP20 family protein
MTNIIKKENARPATFGSVVDQLFHPNLNRFFDDEFWGFNGVQGPAAVAVNIAETDTTYELEVVAPGLNKQDFQLQCKGDTLTISFEYTEQSSPDKEGQRWLRREFRKQAFSRTFTVDETVDTDKASARYENGVLYLTLPKKAQARPVSRNIAVQ